MPRPSICPIVQIRFRLSGISQPLATSRWPTAQACRSRARSTRARIPSTSKSRDISTLGNFNTSGNFTLDDTVALSITGSLNAGVAIADLELGTNALDEDGGIGTITAGD